MRRSRWLRTGVWTLLAGLTVAVSAQAPRQKQATKYFQGAKAAAAWLRATAVETPKGLVWRRVPDDPDSPVETNLYHGDAGVAIFFAQLYRYTRDPADLRTLRGAADALYAAIPRGAAARRLTQEQLGLYTGLPGVAVALQEAFLATGEERYRIGARRATLLVKRALERTLRPSPEEDRAEPVLDVVSGYAGTGLFLLWAHRVLSDQEALQLATQLGDRLLALAERVKTGLRWRMRPGAERIMPNFSHGTAGVAYFLADLHQATKERRFLEAAEQAAEHLWALASQSARPGLAPHHLDGGEELFYLSWCHGPAGTGRLFVLLWKITGDEKYERWLREQARAVLDMGAPAERSEGYWNNVGQCCGTAGVGEFFFGLAQQFGDRRFFNVALQAGDVLLQAMTRDAAAGGGKWVQAEHRARPEETFAQTGFMQGAAGVGLFLLRLDAALNDERAGARLPDWPFD